MAFSAAYGLHTKRQVEHIRWEQAAVANAISRFEPVTMLANHEDVETVKKFCGNDINIVEMEHYDIWTRDTFPSIVFDQKGRPAAVSWNFNVWGGKLSGYEADRDLARRFAQHQSFPLIEAEIVTEAGAFDVDGEGTLLTTETSLLNSNRNPGLSRSDIEAELQRLTGARRVIWLHGSDAIKLTDGHIDGIARFVKPGVVVVEVTDDPYDPEHRDLLENVRQLEGQTDAQGRTLEVVRIKRPRWDVMGERGDEFAASYVNCYFANGGIIMPKFGDAVRDTEARDIFHLLLPDREIVQLRLDEICESGGGIHCSIQQIPAV